MQANRDAEAYVANLPWWRDYDAMATAKGVRQPALILHGAADRNMSASHADSMAAAMRGGGNGDVTVRIFPGLNHFLLKSPSGTGRFEEYGTLTDTALPDEVMGTLTNWLAARLRK